MLPVLPNPRTPSIGRSCFRICDISQVLRGWHLASLDAPTVAVAWSSAFAWAAHVRLPHWLPVLIALAVWTVYVADRLLDARSGLRSAHPARLRERHFFHWRHRRVLAPLAAAAALASAWIIFRLMPPMAREHDSLLAAASTVYFVRVHTSRSRFRLPSKEFLVGMLFTAGCAIPALSRVSSYWPLAALVAFFALLAWLNCYAIDRWEAAPESYANRLVIQSPIAPLAGCLALTGAISSALLFTTAPRQAALFLCGSLAALLLAWLDRRRARMAPVTLRAAADLVLLTPLVLIPLAGLFPR